MIITFCGHSQFFNSSAYEEAMLELLEREVGDSAAEFYLGGYGGFDSFAYACCKKYQSTHPTVRLIFVTPYLKVAPIHERNYDDVVYPELEDKPPRFAITYRNRYMIDKADFVISFVDHEWGGAYKTYTYAAKKGKRIINLAEIQE